MENVILLLFLHSRTLGMVQRSLLNPFSCFCTLNTEFPFEGYTILSAQALISPRIAEYVGHGSDQWTLSIYFFIPINMLYSEAFYDQFLGTQNLFSVKY